MEDGSVNNKTISGMKCILYLFILLALPVQAASFDCAKAGTKVEKLICGDTELSKLDEELNTAYKTALQDQTRADATKLSQKLWLQERNVCSDTICLQISYMNRNKHLQRANNAAAQQANIATKEQSKTGSSKVIGEVGFDPSSFKGEYILVRGAPLESVCKRFKDNLNRFRKLDFDQCDPRLSDKFPEFSRPYQWKKIPFDMALAEKAIRSSTEYGDPAGYPEDIEYQSKEGEVRWQQWKKGSESFRAAGTAHMWIAKIDMDGDGKEDTILRMTPGGRYPIDPKRPSLWSCDYNIGELYVIKSGNQHMAAQFNIHASWASDIIRYAEDGGYYLVSWEAGTSTTTSWFNQDLPDIGGTRGLVISSLYMISPDSYAMPATMCLIDWVPTGHFIATPKPQHKHTPVTH